MNRRFFIRLGAGGALALGLPGCLDNGSGGREDHPMAIGENKMIFDADGNIFVVRPADHSIDKTTPDGEVIWTLGEFGEDPGALNYPLDIATGPNRRLYVCDHAHSQIEVFDENGLYLNTFGAGVLNSPQDIAVGPDGNLYVADSLAHEVEVFSPEGALLRTIGRFGTDATGLNCPRSIAIGPERNLHVVDSGNGRIMVFDLLGVFIRSYGSFGEDTHQFHMPAAITIDNDGYSYVADSYDSSIHVFDPEGEIADVFTPAFPDGTPAHPLFITFTPDGTLYVQAVEAFDGSSVEPPESRTPQPETEPALTEGVAV